MSEQAMEQQNTEQSGPSPEEFVSGLVNDDGSLNEEAAFEAEIETEMERSGPARGPDGRFVSARQDYGDGEDADPDTDTGPEMAGYDMAEEAEDDEEPDEPALRAPNAFTAEQREAFYALPPEHQEAVLDIVKSQQRDYTQKTQELAEQRRAIEPLGSVLRQHQHKFAHLGQPPERVVDQLLTLADHADRDFVGFVREQARLRGIPMEAFGLQEGEEEGYQAADPRVAALQQELAQLRHYMNQDIQQRQAVALQSMERTVDDFSQDEDHPFYDELEEDMVPLAAMLRQINPDMHPRDILARAYRAALSMNDQVSAKAEVDRRAREEPARQRRAREEAARARRSAMANVTGNGALPAGDGFSANDLSKVPDFIAQAYDRLQRA